MRRNSEVSGRELAITSQKTARMYVHRYPPMSTSTVTRACSKVCGRHARHQQHDPQSMASTAERGECTRTENLISVPPVPVMIMTPQKKHAAMMHARRYAATRDASISGGVPGGVPSVRRGEGRWRMLGSGSVCPSPRTYVHLPRADALVLGSLVERSTKSTHAGCVVERERRIALGQPAVASFDQPRAVPRLLECGRRRNDAREPVRGGERDDEAAEERDGAIGEGHFGAPALEEARSPQQPQEPYEPQHAQHAQQEEALRPLAPAPLEQREYVEDEGAHADQVEQEPCPQVVHGDLAPVGDPMHPRAELVVVALGVHDDELETHVADEDEVDDAIGHEETIDTAHVLIGAEGHLGRRDEERERQCKRRDEVPRRQPAEFGAARVEQAPRPPR